eukprot:gene67859-92964_t
MPYFKRTRRPCPAALPAGAPFAGTSPIRPTPARTRLPPHSALDRTMTMDSFKKLKIGTQLLLSFGVVSALILVLATFAAVQMGAINGAVDQ